MTDSSMKSQTLQKWISLLLFIALIVILGVLSTRFSAALDWTAGGRNTLTEASQAQLASMDGPIIVRAFVYSGDPRRRDIELDFARYQRAKADIEVRFIDPSTQPQQVREFDIREPGQIVLEYDGRRETIPGTTEPMVTTALQRLAVSGEQWVVFLAGHGERSISREDDSRALTGYANALRERGLKVQSVNLTETPAIPDNTSVLVLASPERAYLPGEIELVRDYVARGGNLLWLADPDHPVGLAEVAGELGVTWLDGYAIFPDYQVIGTGHPGFFAATQYPANAVTQGFDQITLFPLVRAMAVDKVNDWTMQPMLVAGESAWLETGDISGGTVALDDDDIPGPLLIGATLTRDLEVDGENRTQRVALVGDADFLSDLHLAEVGNEAFGLNLAQWLALRDAQLNIRVPEAPDTDIVISPLGGKAIVAVFVIVLPLLLLLVGVGRWFVRRRR